MTTCEGRYSDCGKSLGNKPGTRMLEAGALEEE